MTKHDKLTVLKSLKASCDDQKLFEESLPGEVVPQTSPPHRGTIPFFRTGIQSLCPGISLSEAFAHHIGAAPFGPTRCLQHPNDEVIDCGDLSIYFDVS
jgi:hypothetical protein